ncbi:MAG: ATP-dependent helicase, partial [Terriglobia bacterium]
MQAANLDFDAAFFLPLSGFDVELYKRLRDLISPIIAPRTNTLKTTSSLNSVQKEAVTQTDGPSLIIAGAGSGKTKVLAHRVAYLLGERGVDPGSILAITFTNKAAEEMRERIAALTGSGSRAMWIGTFHATCARILRRDIDRFGLKKSFVIYDDTDKNRLVNTCLADLDYDNKRYPARQIGAAISAAKCELIDHETYRAGTQSFIEEVVGDVYRLYQERLFRNNAVDFDDLLGHTVNLFRAYPDVLKAYGDKFKYVLVDEYQDTNKAQYHLINLLAKEHRNLCVVGDPDQSIYKFRGADIRNILEFEHDFPEARIYNLEQNYRSTELILKAANHVIENNSGRKAKNLWTSRGGGELVVSYKGQNEHDEAAYVVAEVEELLADKGLSYEDCAVFYRTNAQSRVFEDVFMRNGLPYKIVGGVKFYERQEIKDFLSYLRIIVNPSDDVSLRRVFNRPKRGLGKTTEDRVARFAEQAGISFFNALLKSSEIPGLGSRALKELDKFGGVLKELRALEGQSDLVKLAEEVLEKTRYLKVLEAERTVEAMGRVENVKEFISVVSEFHQRAPEKKLEDFLAEIALVTDIDNYDADDPAVTLMTLHNAKGLEFPVVFIVGMEEGLMALLDDPEKT